MLAMEPSISIAQAVALLFFTPLLLPSSIQPILEPDSEPPSVSAAHVSVFTAISLTAVTPFSETQHSTSIHSLVNYV